MRRIARIAAITLLLVWVGPVGIVQNDVLGWLAGREASASPELIPAGQALVLQPGTEMRLRLRDKNVVSGRFLGRALMDSARYAARFHEAAGDSEETPIALGETLFVVLHDGREWNAPFAGYGEKTLLLSSPGEPQPVRVPLEFAREIRRASGEVIPAKAITRALRSLSVPSAEVLVIEDLHATGTEAERWDRALRLPVDDIESVLVKLESTSESGARAAGMVAGTVILSVMATLVILVLLAKQASHDCNSWSTNLTPEFGGFLTARPFDLSRGVYVGDSLVAAGPWPAPERVVTTAAEAEPQASPSTDTALR